MSVTLSLLLLALALASDAFAVALAQGAATRPPIWRRALLVGGAFGFAQGVAPVIGWAIGLIAAQAIRQVDHWVAFALLAGVGAKMLWEGVRGDPLCESGPKAQPAGGWVLAALAVATSIDAVAAGFTLPTIGAPIAVSAVAIGLITFALSAAGVWIGRTASAALGSKAEIVGGLVLMVLAARVLIDHRAFG